MIAGFVPFTLIDYPDTIASTIFFSGCPWRCWYCHNKNIVLGHKDPRVSWEKIYSFLKQKVNFIDGVVLSGGEPLMHDIQSIIVELKSLGYRVKLDTNGAYPEVLESIVCKRLVDFVAMDIKAPLDKYHEIIGVSWDPKKVLTSVEVIKKFSIPHQFRTTYDAMFGFSIDELEKIVGEKIVIQPCNRELASIPWNDQGA